MKKIVKPIVFIKRLIQIMRTSIQKSIRIQLITTFVFCVFLGFLVTRVTTPLFEDMNKRAIIDYSSSMEQINMEAKSTAETTAEENSIVAINNMIEDENQRLKNGQNALKVLVTDETGKVLYKTKQAQEVQINLHDMMSNVMSFAINAPAGKGEVELSRREFITFYPVTIKGKNLYLFVSGIPEGDVSYETKKGPFPFIIGFLVFIFTFFYITKRKMKQIEAMARGVKEIAKGNLAYRIEMKGQDEIASLTGNINHMAEELMVKIEKERKVEKQKNQLITNVSHDLRTPLTSIMGYLSLLRDGKYENNQQHNEYIKIAYSKSEQLQNLIEDLFEYTKLTDENFVLDLQEVCINKLLDQLIEELVPQIEERSLTIEKKFSDEDLYAVVDSEQTVRLFDNLLMNAIKYSKDNGEILVSLEKQPNNLKISVANYSEEFTKEELENLFERFYKKDQSRSRVEEGSGLGLAIAKSIVELQGGEIQAEYEDGVIRFIILLPILGEN
ncbi:histidine kinase [Heyndrickxia shackletonii]|uniref:histidine kinase n=1 Tax=Heyndrickxia shackletonii TaxID=157838 RepID=A0A0Q3TJL5_9BACI|nr:HAMP domain-containing sensor histidine kinase [Heyndrickxia shackletonii]KQL54158.1 histidine kinase [Heyndrickxia shackletonii]NEY99283.1 HAMP domain-containing histidine kinase [Heyndrickxia shackletonii]